MRKPVISGNWKMYNDIPAAVSLVEGIKKGVTGVNNVEMIVIPPYIDIACVKEAVKGSMIGFGAQNLHWEEEGAFTGE
ncbi:MAG TPA: triose-phosphate isomerase, partial [Candidatus Omnitrophota bacterium]|nr:triose-phosphate isomerase [Candidatus Omnitrophota bacterium]